MYLLQQLYQVPEKQTFPYLSGFAAVNRLLRICCKDIIFILYHPCFINEREFMNTTKIKQNEDSKITGIKLFSIDQVCRQLGIGRFSVYQLINQGRLKTVKINARRLVSYNALQKFITELEQEYEG